MSLELELIADYECLTGEGPLWHPEEQCVYWLDIPAGKIFRFDPNVNTHRLFYEGPAPIGGFTLQEDGAFLLFGNRGAISVLRDGVVTPVIPEIPAEADGRFNDVIADPLGRVFCGTMPTDAHMGRLYRLDLDGTLTAVLDDVNISNGMGFTPGLTGMYHTDTAGKTISLFDYDQATGALTNRRTFVHSLAEAGMPDGMTVDAEGCVWSAQWDGGCLIRYAPDGTELRRIAFPAKKVSSAIFGGPDLLDLYVTTAGGNDKAANGPGAGGLFRLRPGVRGVPEYRSRIQLPGA
jgi:D-xylono/L-arabinono-1,4-lactonase